jgi:hypothetical protein
MQSIADKLADVTRRIADSEQCIAKQQEHIPRGNCGEAALAALVLYSAAGTLRELRIYKVQLEHLIAVKAPASGCEHMHAGAADEACAARARRSSQRDFRAVMGDHRQTSRPPVQASHGATVRIKHQMKENSDEPT